MTRVRRVRRVGPAGRQWERNLSRCRTYTPRRPPRAQLLLAPADSASNFAGSVLVLNTHHRSLAAKLASPVWADQHADQLSEPTIGWWRQVPADDVIPDSRGETDRSSDSLWWPVPAGTPTAVPGVEFAFPQTRRAGS